MVGVIATAGLWLLSLIILILAIFYLYVKYLYRYFKKRGIPYETPSFPFGNLAPTFWMNKSISFTLPDIYARNKQHKLVGYFNLWKKQILIIEPEIVKHVLIRDFDIFQDRGVYYNKEKDPLSAHLFSLDGDAWKLLRAKLSPTFTSGKLKGMHSIFLDCSNMLCAFVEAQKYKKTNIECQTMFAKYFQVTISATAFGIADNCLTEESTKFFEMVRKTVQPTLERLLAFAFMLNGQVAKTLNIRVIPQDVSQFFMGLVKDTIKLRESNGIKKKDYLQQLIDMMTINPQEAVSQGISLTEEELAAQAFIFILAGTETSSSTMSFCCYELSRNPEIQARLHQELDALPDISYDNVYACQYLDMVVSETLRKYSPLGLLVRECSQDYQVPDTNVVIEKGTQVVVSLQGMHNDPDLFPDPEVFDPERFSKENKDNIKAYTYMPFGDGKRYCIGMRFASIVVKTGLAALLRRYQVCGVDQPPSLKVEPRTVITTVAGGLWLSFKERSSG